MTEKRFLFKHQNTEYSCDLEDDDTIQNLKRKIGELTNVQPKRQKLLGVKTLKGGVPKDEDLISQCSLKAGQRYSVMGQPEETIMAQDAALLENEVEDMVDDLSDKPQKMKLTQADLDAALERRGSKYHMKKLNPPRPGMKCLVLDIDYTFFDMSSSAEIPAQLLRPHLHELLREVYPYYDIIVWSANSMRWIEVKLRELGLTTSQNYKISMLLDGTCMIPVTDPASGDLLPTRPLKHMVDSRHHKMACNWTKFGGKTIGEVFGSVGDVPEAYKPENTIMADDLRRNFIFNPHNAYVIPPYKNCHQTFATDTELLWLKNYLLLIRSESDLRRFRHSRAKKFVAERLLPSELKRCTHPGE